MAASFVTAPGVHALATASSVAKTRATNVSAGNLVFGVTFQRLLSNTLTNVTYDVDGSTASIIFGPIDQTYQSLYPYRIYGWAFYNTAAGGTPTAGTFTANWSGVASTTIVLWEGTGLAGGGALDVFKTATGLNSNPPDSGASGTLAQSSELAVGFVIGYGQVPTADTGAGWTDDVHPDGFLYERAERRVTAATTSINATWGPALNTDWIATLMTFKDAGGGGGGGSGAGFGGEGGLGTIGGNVGYVRIIN